MSPSILPGLVSVTFRNLAWEEIAQLAVASGLSGIEWGGDVHVPPGDISLAEKIRRRCLDSGLQISAYGSYYRAGAGSVEFDPFLETALALGTETVRVWAGSIASQQMPDSEKQVIIDDLRRCCASAAKAGLDIATEFHAGTLTDEADACMQLIEAVDAPNLRTFWQPPNGMEFQAAAKTLRRVRGKLSHIHVFHWWPTADDRQPLESGRDRWKEYLAIVSQQSILDGHHRFASLEFVRSDDVEQFRKDAATLCELLAQGCL